MAGKPKRLSKVTKEFNLGLSTVVDFLQEKGFEVEGNANAKISPEMYEALSGEFQTEKKVKEKSNKIEVKKPIKETISIEEEKPKPEPVVEKPKVEETAPEPVVEVIAQVPEPSPVTISIPEPIVERKPERESKPELDSKLAPEPDAEEIPIKKGGLKVLGKIDLKEIEQKQKKPARKPKKEEDKSAKMVDNSGDKKDLGKLETPV